MRFYNASGLFLTIILNFLFMDYVSLFNDLTHKYNYKDDRITVDQNCTIFNLNFQSTSFKLLPGEDEYVCKQHKTLTHDPYDFKNETGIIHEVLDVHDSSVEENKNFPVFHFFFPEEGAPRVLFFFCMALMRNTGINTCHGHTV